MPENMGPCEEKNCSWCCDPVKLSWRAPEDIVPVDENGNKVWIKRKEHWSNVEHPDTEHVKVYDCVHFDKAIGKCKNYENRPEICRNTSCVNPDDKERSIDEQHQRLTSTEFYKRKFEK